MMLLSANYDKNSSAYTAKNKNIGEKLTYF